MSSFGRAWCWLAVVAGLTATVLPWPASGVGAGLSAAEVGRAVMADRVFGLVPTWLGLLVLGPVVAGGLLLVASAIRRLRWPLLALAGVALAGGDAVAYGLGAVDRPAAGAWALLVENVCLVLVLVLLIVRRIDRKRAGTHDLGAVAPPA